MPTCARSRRPARRAAGARRTASTCAGRPCRRSSPARSTRASSSGRRSTPRANLFFAPQGYLPDGLEGKTFMADSSKIQTTESDKPQANPASGDTTTPAVPDPSAAPPPPEATSPLPGTPTETGAPVDLWDSGWPNGRYYWTVVAAEPRLAPNLVTYLAAPVHPWPAGAPRPLGNTSGPGEPTAGPPIVPALSPPGRPARAAGTGPRFSG